ELVTGQLRRPPDAPDDDAEQRQQRARPRETELLTDRGEDEVGVLLGHIAEPGLTALEQALAEGSARADRRIRLVDVVLRLREGGVVLGGHVLGQERREP